MSRWHCEPCNVAFTSKRALKRHQVGSRTHSSTTTTNATSDLSAIHKCPTCSKTFVRQHDLRRHNLEQHQDGKKPCPKCKKVIRLRASHQDDSGYACSGRAPTPSHDHSSYDSNLGNMIQLAYIGNPTYSMDRYSCNYCTESFKDEDSQALSQHMEKHLIQLASRVECSHCQVIFQQGHDLVLHLSCAENFSQSGFDFEHQIPCTGHHPPAASDDIAYPQRNQDRRTFCTRLRSWEHSQLQRYRERITESMFQQVQDDSAHKVVPYTCVQNYGQCKRCKANVRLHRVRSGLSVSLRQTLMNLRAWEDVDHVFDFNEDHLFSHEWNSKDRTLYKEFFQLMRNLVRLNVDREDILNTLQAVTRDPGLLRRLFEWRQITVTSQVHNDGLSIDTVAMFLLEGICRDLGCGWLLDKDDKPVYYRTSTAVLSAAGTENY